MEYIRNNPENAYRFSENFWDSQIQSKQWLLDHIDRTSQTICIFGGWYGVLAQFIANKNPYAYIVTTDIDESCGDVFRQINVSDNILFKHWDMVGGIPMSLDPDLVINTSTEHVRLANNLEHFLEINRIVSPEYAGILKCGHFYRFMAVGVK